MLLFPLTSPIATLCKNQSVGLILPAGFSKCSSETPHWHQEERPYLPCTGFRTVKRTDLPVLTTVIKRFPLLALNCGTVCHSLLDNIPPTIFLKLI